ncbi:MAG TPA: hypothetical protein VNU01_06700, partial [Egibacteraceae bacterium]|nr:hypothetical protein [Egibacteraceae bacterium]
MRHPTVALAALAVAVAALAAPAGAETTVVTGSLGTSVSISTAPSAAVDLGSLALGLNTAGGGTIAVTANTAYTVTVAADKAAMTQWNGTAYGTTALG